MNTNSKTKNKDIQKNLDALFGHFSPEELLEKDAFLVHMKIISEVEKKMEKKGWKKKDLAKAVQTSASYITQLFRGDRMVNMLMIAKFQQALDGEFAIKWCNKNEKYHMWKVITQEKKHPKDDFSLSSFTLSDIENAAVDAA